ncbi:TMC protein [Trinorchestia longiramus]|nr:TMC protein [Trinorchestia longiramus]
MDRNSKNIELDDHGASKNYSGSVQPPGILHRTSVSFRGRDGRSGGSTECNVAWSSTLPATPSQFKFLEGNSRSNAVGSAKGDWQHTLAVRRTQGLLHDTDSIDGITQAMEADLDLMADDMHGEVKRRNVIRELTQPLASRKVIKRRLTASSRRQRSKKLSCWQKFKYSVSMSVFRTKEHLKAALHDYSLWHNDLKIIEGAYGTGVGTYFRFLRYLLLLNLTIAVALFCLLTVPQLVGEVSGHVTNATLGVAVEFPVSSSNTSLQQPPFRALDWLSGAGWLQWTALYYAGYSSWSVCVSSDCSSFYDLRFAYICCVLACFLACLIVIARRVIKLYKEHAMSNVGDEVGTTMATVVFSLWDYGITEEKAAHIKHSSIYNELKVTVQELQERQQQETWKQWAQRRLLQGVCWFVVLGFMALLSWFVYELLENILQQFYEQQLESKSYASEVGTLLVFPVIVSAVLLLLPLSLEYFVKLECYSSTRIEVAVTLIRTTLLELLVLAVLLSFWFGRSPRSDIDTSTSSSVITNVTCWESSLGAELYRLTVVDFLVQVLGSVVLLVAFKLAPGNRLLRIIGEFSVARNTLQLVFTQTLVWAALFFAPLLAIVAVIKLLLLFYLQKVLVLYSLPPRGKPWRAAQTQTIFFALIFVSLVMTALATGFVLIRGCSSEQCGPLVGSCPYVSVFWDLVEQDNKPFLLNVVQWLVKPGVVAAIIFVLMIGVYWARAMALGRAELVAILRQQLELEAKDRAFLIDLGNKIVNGQQRVRTRVGPSSPQSAPPVASGIARGSFTFCTPGKNWESAENKNIEAHMAESPASLQSNGSDWGPSRVDTSRF